MSESIPHHFFNPPCLYWLPKITHHLYDNIDRVLRSTLDGDPLLFIPRPIWKVFSKECSNDFMLIKISDTQDISIYLVYKYYGMNWSKISHICITEDWWKNDPSHGCDVRVATINPSDCMVKWILNDNQIINRVANVLIKLKLVKWIS